MMLSLRKKGYPTLYQTASAVAQDTDLYYDVKQMFHIMDDHDGIGLAANQVGLLQRIIIVDANGIKQEFINPVITKRFGGLTNSKEGCLSFPGAMVLKVRCRRVTIEGFTHDWQPIKRNLKGVAAYVVQHEVDHLGGKNIVKGSHRWVIET